MEPIRHVVLPLAGKATRLFPASAAVPKGLIPLVDTDGVAKAAVQIMATECALSGVETIVLVVSPGSQTVYRRYFEALQGTPFECVAGAPLIERLRFVEQADPFGFGHAVWCAREAVKNRPFGVLLGDHVYLPEANLPCVKQALAAAETCDGPVYTVHPVPENTLGRFGVIGADPVQGSLFRVREIVEKPTVETARERLKTPGLPEGSYFAHFGIYLFPPEAMQTLDRMVAERVTGEVQLTDCQKRLLAEGPAYAFAPAGRSHDFGVPEGLLATMAAFGARSHHGTK